MRNLSQRHFVHPLLSLPTADQLCDLRGLMIQIAMRQFVEIVIALAGVEQVAGNHRVERRAGQFDSGRTQHDHVVLQILSDLGNRWVLQHPSQRRQRLGRV